MECALWYWCHGSLCVDLFDSEEEAAEDAVRMELAGDAAVKGVQFPTGEFLDVPDWPAYLAEYQRRNAEMEAEIAESSARPAAPTRKVVAPFDPRASARVRADAPSWLGAHPVASRSGE